MASQAPKIEPIRSTIKWAAPSIGADPSMDVGDDYAEFEAYRQWLEWKTSAEGTAEYEEFQAWREWRRYREWKNQN